MRLAGKILSLVLISVLTLTAIFFGTVSILKTLYPMGYGDFVEKYAQENNLENYFVYAVIECESGYDEKAVSSVGARGLMQIMPETFLWLSEKRKETVSEETLFDAETNIKYGCYFYGILMERYGNEATALAAYHAGMGNVDKWLKDENCSADGKSLYNIPFESTKNYVNKVLKTKNIYKKLYQGKEE